MVFLGTGDAFDFRHELLAHDSGIHYVIADRFCCKYEMAGATLQELFEGTKGSVIPTVHEKYLYVPFDRSTDHVDFSHLIGTDFK